MRPCRTISMRVNKSENDGSSIVEPRVNYFGGS